MGFDYFYGFMGGETDQWTPYLFQDHTQIFPWVAGPLQPHHRRTRRSTMNSSTPRRPTAVLRYYVPGKPLATPAEEGVERQVQGQVRHGLECLREQIFANQKRLGSFPRMRS
jgi:arylsulfatase